MRKTLALVISTAFILGSIGGAVAQTSTTPPITTTAPPPATPAPAPAPAPTTKTTPEEKAKKAMAKADQVKATCLQKAGADDVKKAECEKLYAAAKAKITQAEKKAETKK